jgi:hypothetical protein
MMTLRRWGMGLVMAAWLVWPAVGWASGFSGGTVTPGSTDTLTNKTLDTEATGNVVTVPFTQWFVSAGCDNATAGPVWDLPTANAPTPACVTGSNIQKGVLTFADSAEQTAQLSMRLPADWTGAVDATVFFTSATTTNTQTEIWKLYTACRAPTGGSGATDDPAFNTAQSLTYTLGASEVASALRKVSQTGVTMTGCTAGDLWHIKIGRDNNDTDTASMNLIGVEVVYRRAL